MTKVLVYGYYNKSNLGDDLFVDAFKALFPNYQLSFTDDIKLAQLEGIDAIFFGGGSFLAESLKASDEVFQKLKTLKLFYIGVGGETALDPRHQELMTLSQLIATRSSQNLDNLQQVNPNCMVIPDLVYALEPNVPDQKHKKSILIIPNILVVPKWSDPHWKHSAWDYFKIELAQTIDQLIKDGYKIDFLSFCQNNYLNDSYAAAEIVARTNTITPKQIFQKPNDFQSAINVISKYQLVVSQRYHGLVLADLSRVPSLSIHHHDKLKSSSRPALSYYGTSKNTLLEKIKNVASEFSSVLPIDRNIFRQLTQRVEHALRGDQE